MSVCLQRSVARRRHLSWPIPSPGDSIPMNAANSSAPAGTTRNNAANSHISSPSVGSELCDATVVVVPPDGGYGWVIVVASFFSNFLIEGCNSSFSTYIKDLTEAFHTTEPAILLIGSLLVGIDQLSGPLASGIANRYGFRTALMMGGFLGCTGLAISHFSTSVVYLYFSYGILGGIGSGLVYVPAVIAVNFFFSRWRALAVSVAMVGSNFGGATMPHLIGYNVSVLGWRNAMLVQAGLMLCCSVLGLFFRPPPATHFTQTTATHATQGTVTPVSITSTSLRRGHGDKRNYPSVMEVLAESNGHMVLSTITRRPSQVREATPVREQTATTQQTLVQVAKETRRIGCCARCLRTVFCCACCRRRGDKFVRPFYRDDIFYEGSTVRLAQYEPQSRAGAHGFDMKMTRVTSQREILERLSARCVMFPHALRRTLGTMCDVTLLRSVPMTLVALSFMFSSAAYYIPFTYLRLRELDKGGDEMRATMFMSVISFSAMVGRIVCALFSSLPCANHFYIISVTQTLGGLAMLICAVDPPYEAQIVCSVFYGFALACTSNLRSLIIVDLVGLQNLTNAFGLVMLFQGVGFILGPPIAGLIKDASGQFPSVFWFAGGMILTSALLTYPLNELRKRGPPGDLL